MAHATGKETAKEKTCKGKATNKSNTVNVDFMNQCWNMLDEFKLDSDDASSISMCSTDTDALEICDNCGSSDVQLVEGNMLCQGCNCVLAQFIDMTAEWRYYGSEDSKSGDPSRCGAPMSALLPNSSLGSIISYSRNETRQMRMIRKYSMWNNISYKERNLYTIFDMLTVNAVNNGIPKTIIEQAKVYYKQLSELKIFRGENRSGLIASSIYMSCKHHGVPRSTKEIAKIFNLKVTTMTKGCKNFMDMIHMQMDATTAADFIHRFCSYMKLDATVRDIAKHVVETADELNIICESTPPSIAAASIYLVGILCNLNFTKKDVSDSCDISQVTIGKCYKKLYAYRHHIFTEEVKIEYEIV